MIPEETKEAALQWINEGKPCRYRCGYAYRGAWLRPLTNEKALEMLPKYNFTDGPAFYELLWSTDDNGEVILIFNEYTENDLW
jgi:hypothetical protein